MKNEHSPKMTKIREYVGAFCRLTGMPTSFVSAPEEEEQKPAKDFSMCRNAFCQLLQKYPGGESLCQRTHDEAAQKAHKCGHAVRTRCPFGLASVAVPVKGNDGRKGTLITGEVLLRAPSKSTLDKQLRKAFADEPWFNREKGRLWSLFRRSRVVTQGEFKALGKTFQIAADHIGGGDGLHLEESDRAEIATTLEALKQNPAGQAIVKTKAARAMLRENTAVRLNREERHLRIHHLGRGSYSVTVASVGEPQTHLVK